MRDFLTFRYMITPGLIMIVWLLGALALLIGPFAAIVAFVPPDGGAAVAAGPRPTFGGSLSIWQAIAIALIGNVAWRIVCEQAMVFFAIHSALNGAKPDKGITATMRV